MIGSMQHEKIRIIQLAKNIPSIMQTQTKHIEKISPPYEQVQIKYWGHNVL